MNDESKEVREGNRIVRVADLSVVAVIHLNAYIPQNIADVVSDAGTILVLSGQE